MLCRDVLTNQLLSPVNATTHSLWDVSPGNPVSGLVVVVVVEDSLFSQFILYPFLLTFCHDVHTDILILKHEV
jgi:hypothetical protein